jgi:ribosomal protein S18 acetylase RimI-like enzyme
MEHAVRRIRAGEWRQYRELRLAALKDTPLAFAEQYENSLARTDQYWQSRVERSATGGAASTFVAVHAGGFIGKASCIVETEVAADVSAQVVGVYVSPHFRRQGIARALVPAALRWAREELGAVRVRLFVMQGNDRAAALYRGIGFVRTGVTMAYPANPAYTEDEMEYRAGA